jgi:uncharacterized lipoprotein YmbA
MKRDASPPCALGAALLLCGAALAGCASSGLRVDEYVLTAPAREAAASFPGVSPDPVIGVGPIDVPTYLRRPEIVVRGLDGRLELRPGERWGEDLSAGFARSLAAGLASFVPSSRVFIRPFPAAIRPDAVVGVQILRFAPVAGGPVELDLQWALDVGGRALPPQRVSLREPVAEDTTPARVAAMSRAVEELAVRVAAQVRETFAARSAHLADQ